jgi:hypothetical protein
MPWLSLSHASNENGTYFASEPNTSFYGISASLSMYVIGYCVRIFVHAVCMYAQSAPRFGKPYNLTCDTYRETKF